MNDECSGCSLIERNWYQYGVHAIIVFCKAYDTVHKVHGVPEVWKKVHWGALGYFEKNSGKVDKNSANGVE